MNKLSLIFLLFTSCMTRNDPIVGVYVNEFNERYNTRYQGSYYFSKPGDLVWWTLGVCYSFAENSKLNRLVINVDAWDKLSEIAREQLVYHELGHCVFNLGHNDDYMKNGCPESLMNSYQMPDSCYVEYRKYYLDSLPIRINKEL